MKKNPLMAALKAEFIAAFEAGGITKHKLGREAGTATTNVDRLLDPNTGTSIDTLDRAFRALGKRIEIRVVALLIALLPGAIAAQPAPAPDAPQPCAVQVVIDLQTYEGPKHFENFCLSLPAMYGNGLLSVEATGMGDGIFKDGFDGANP